MGYIHDSWCDLDKDGQCDCYVALLEARDKRIAQLEAKLQYMTDIANEEHASSAHIAMRNGELEAENERLKNTIEILKMVVMESPEALKLARDILDTHNNKTIGGE